MVEIKKYFLDELDESAYLAFSTGINMDMEPAYIEERVFDDEITINKALATIVPSNKLIFIDHMLGAKFKQRKYPIVKSNPIYKVLVIEEMMDKLVYELLKEYEYTNVFFIADYSGECDVFFPTTRMDGFTFKFAGLKKLYFIRFEEKKIIIFQYF